MSAVKPRIQNALETGMVIETNGKYVSDLRHFTSRRGFVPEPQLKLHSAAFAEYLGGPYVEKSHQTSDLPVLLYSVKSSMPMLHCTTSSKALILLKSNQIRMTSAQQYVYSWIFQKSNNQTILDPKRCIPLHIILAFGKRCQYLCIYLSICLSIYLFLSLSFSLYLSIYLSSYLSIYFIIYRSIKLTIYLSI